MVMLRLGQRIRTRGPNPNLVETTGAPMGVWQLRTPQGATVTNDTALGVSAFFRGVQLIASLVGGLPIHVFREKADGTSESLKTPGTYYLRRRPNVEMTKQTLWEHLVADEVRGNAFIWVDKDEERASIDPIGIWYIDRRRVAVGRSSSGRKVYLIDDKWAMIDYKEGGEIIHIPNWGDGLVGYDVVKVARTALSLGMTAEEYAANYFDQNDVPPGYLSSTQILSPEESDEIEERWHARRAGTKNQRRIAVISGGSTFTSLNTEPEKAQMQELRQFQGEEVARFLGIPPHMLGFTEKVTSWGQGIAEQTLGFVRFTVQSHVNRFEEATNDALLMREQTDRYVKFAMEGLLRGTTLQRFQAYKLADWMTTNEKRGFEDLPPKKGGDELPVPSTMIPIEDLGSNFEQPPVPPQRQPAEEE